MIEPTVEALFRKFWRRLKKQANVVGFDGALREKQRAGHVYKDWLTWRIYVDRKLPLSYLKGRDIVPRAYRLKTGKSVEDICTDIVAIGKPVIPPLLGMQKSTKDRWRPLEAGVSSMHHKGTACTLDGIFVHTGSAKYIQASNYHCYGLEGDANPGDPVMNPSPHDGGKLPGDRTGGYLFGVPIVFDEYKCRFRNFLMRRLPFWTWRRPAYGQNDVDIAFASVDVEWVNKIAREKKGFLGFADPVEGAPVAKCGRTTDRTEGVWESVNMHINCEYKRGVALMTDVAMANLKCAGGDSGSPMYHPESLIYNAALFAGSNRGKSFGCTIGNIMRRAPVRLATVFS